MSWNAADYGYGGYSDFASDSYPTSSGSFGLGKRSHSPDTSSDFKKPKSYGSQLGGPTSWDQVSDNGYTNFDSGPSSWDQLSSKTSSATSWKFSQPSSSSWDSDAGPTSWGQLSEEPKGRGAGGNRGNRGRGGKGRGNSGGSFGGGNFGSSYQSYDSGYSQPSFGGGGRGGGQRGGFGGQQRGGFAPRGRGQQQFGGQAPGRGRGRGAPRGAPRGRGGFGGPQQGGKPLSLVEKFVKFCDFLRKEGVRVNGIQSIENACSGTYLGLKTEYEEEALPKLYNRPLFTGKLAISGIYLARSIGGNKKTLKHEVYTKALKALTELTIAQINDLKDPGMESIKAAIEMYLREDKGASGSMRVTMEDICENLKSKMETLEGLQGGLQKLIAYLKNTPTLPENPISKVTTGLSGSKCNLPHSFECVEDRSADGDKKFMGSLFIGNLCIARAEDKLKKMCKQETFQQGLDALLAKPIDELLIPIPAPEGEDDVETPDGEADTSGMQIKQEESSAPKNKAGKQAEPMKNRLRDFMKVLHTTAFQEDNIHSMDNLASHNGLVVMCLYRKDSPTSDKCSGCELYIDNYLIASGFGPTKKDCLTEAYNRSWEVLTTSTPEDILTQHKKLEPEETAAPSVMEVFIKGGTGLHRESNLHSLRRYGLDPDDEDKIMDDLVIVECSDWHRDRKFNAFCILQYSATANGMLLQWSCSNIQNNYKPNYKNEKKPMEKMKITLYLQKEQIAESTGLGKNRVRNLAAANALFKMYEKHDVITVKRLNDEERWIPWEQIEEESNNLRKSAGQPPRQKKIFEGWEQEVDDYIVRTLKGHITKFFPREDAEELLFGPGIPDKEIKIIQAYSLSLKIRCDTRQFNGETYLVLYVRQDLQNVVKKLKALNGGMYGKYALVPREELPTTADLKVKK